MNKPIVAICILIVSIMLIPINSSADTYSDIRYDFNKYLLPKMEGKVCYIEISDREYLHKPDTVFIACGYGNIGSFTLRENNNIFLYDLSVTILNLMSENSYELTAALDKTVKPNTGIQRVFYFTKRSFF